MSSSDRHFSKLSAALKSMHSTFSCSGSMKLEKPIRLYFHSAANDSVAKIITFPVSSEADFQQLLDACSPASYGRGTEAVLDASYRNALKLDCSLFSTSFDLVLTRVLDEIRQIMATEANGIQAEAYALNIYGPGGHFKTHVDTPRSENMFGSLVVALPYKFTGGSLIVQHEGKVSHFCWGEDEERKKARSDADLGSDQDACLRWAAFYSDCEHEIQEVRSGYRVTVTYNLYYGANNLLREHSMEVTATSLYKEFRNALASRSFLSTGGIIGLQCQHYYAHTSKRAAKVPQLLKGIDALVVTIAHALGLHVDIKPFYRIKEGREHSMMSAANQSNTPGKR